MKKILYGMMAATMIFATSCENELELGAAGEESMVSFTIATPDMGSRAYSDGTTATVLQYAVYNAAGEELTDLTVTNGEIHGSTTVNLQLTTGNTYSVVFWAAAPGAPYTVDFGAKTMTVNYANATSNDESRDAFYAKETFTVTGAQTETITLKRPFAQLNIGTNDYEASKEAGYVPTSSSVTVKNLKNTLNLFNGEVSGDEAARTFALAENNIDKNQTFPVAGYEYLAMNYLLVGTDKETVDVEFTYTDGSNAKTRTVGSVPVQRNYRTNIYGQLLTSDVDVNVEIKPEYDGENKVIVANDHASFVDAISNVTDGGVVRLNADVKVTEENRVNSGGTWYEGVYYVGDKSFTIDLNGFAFKNESGAVNDYMLLFKNDGEKPNTITIKNGKIDAGTTAFCALCTSTTSTQKITINLENVELINNNTNGATIKVRGGAELNVKEGVKITGKNSYVGIEVVNAVTNIYDGAEIYQNGTGSYVGSLAGVSNNGVLNVYGGYGKSVQGGFIAMTSGGIINIEGGEWIANTDGTYANGNKSVLIAQSSSGAKSIINVSGGTFKGGYNCYGDAVGDAQINIEGGNFNSDPSAYVAAGLKAVANNGVYYIVAEEVDAVASTAAEITNAIDNGATKIVLAAGEYVLPNSAKGKTITFVGSANAEDVKVAVTKIGAGGENCDYSLDGSNVTFENITITTNSSTYIGYARCNGTYKNCIINGTYTLYGNSVFENCTFNVSGDVYNIWTWGAPEAKFTDCTFNCDGKSLLLYGQVNTKLTVNNCTFNDNGSISGKAAIEIGNDYNKSYELIVNNTTVNGFDINPNGFVTGTTLWANKNSMPADKLKVTVDGKNAYTIVVDTVDELTNAIENGATEIVLADGNYTMSVGNLQGKTLSLSGSKNAVIDATNVNANNQSYTGATLTFEGVTINFGTAFYMGFANLANLTYKDCNINGLQFLYNKASFVNCKFNSNGAEHSVWTYGSNEVSFAGCEFTYGDRCINVYSEGKSSVAVDFDNCKFTAPNAGSVGAVEINSGAFAQGAEVNFDGCTAPANGWMVFISKWDSAAGANATVTVDGSVISAPVQQ